MEETKIENNTNLDQEEVSHEGVCPFCKEDIKIGAIKCKHCGSDLQSSDVEIVTTNTSKESDTEKEIYNKYDVKITTKRVMVDNKTFALKNITSVSNFVLEGERNWNWIFYGSALLAVAYYFMSTGSIPFMVTVGGSIVAIILGLIKRNTHTVRIATSGGESYYVLYDETQEVRDEITEALNNAIVAS